jgi:hypothetical protein
MEFPLHTVQLENSAGVVNASVLGIVAEHGSVYAKRWQGNKQEKAADLFHEMIFDKESQSRSRPFRRIDEDSERTS